MNDSIINVFILLSYFVAVIIIGCSFLLENKLKNPLAILMIVLGIGIFAANFIQIPNTEDSYMYYFISNAFNN